jgi:2-hydroxy-3-keto-5-methylthiopentenyl-1-phosphate phosphatase
MVWFRGYDKDNEVRKGSMQILGNNGNYINEKEIVDIITTNFNLTGVFIKNFIEFPNEKDFKTYIHGKGKDDGDKSKFRFL